MKRGHVAIVFLLFFSTLKAQTLKKQILKQIDISSGVHAIYQFNAFENYFRIVLYRNHTFSYEETSTNYFSFSNGHWKKSKNVLNLNSDIDSNNVPIKIYYFNTDTVRDYLPNADRTLYNSYYKTAFQIPVDYNKIDFPDAKIFINSDSSFCLPFFDTCIGNVSRYEKIRVDLGNGFKSQWKLLKKGDYKRILIVVQTDQKLSNYYSFVNQKCILRKNRLQILKK